MFQTMSQSQYSQVGIVQRPALPLNQFLYPGLGALPAAPNISHVNQHGGDLFSPGLEARPNTRSIQKVGEKHKKKSAKRSKRADGRYMAQVTIGYDTDGRRQRKAVYANSQAELDQKVTELKFNKQRGIKPSTCTLTVTAYLDQWLHGLSIKPATFARYQSLIRHHINPAIGGCQLKTLEPMQIQRFYAQLKRQNVGDRSRELVHVVLRKALERASALGYIPRNPLLTVTKKRGFSVICA